MTEIAFATKGAATAWATTTTTIPPIIPTSRSIAGRMSDEGASPCTIDMMTAIAA